jgi:hypothetical protein
MSARKVEKTRNYIKAVTAAVPNRAKLQQNLAVVKKETLYLPKESNYDLLPVMEPTVTLADNKSPKSECFA